MTEHDHTISLNLISEETFQPTSNLESGGKRGKKPKKVS